MDLRQQLADAYADLASTLQSLQESEEREKQLEMKIKQLEVRAKREQLSKETVMMMLWKLKQEILSKEKAEDS